MTSPVAGSEHKAQHPLSCLKSTFEACICGTGQNSGNYFCGRGPEARARHGEDAATRRKLDLVLEPGAVLPLFVVEDITPLAGHTGAAADVYSSEDQQVETHNQSLSITDERFEK